MLLLDVLFNVYLTSIFWLLILAAGRLILRDRTAAGYLALCAFLWPLLLLTRRGRAFLNRQLRGA